jgi:hypothetical protein
MSLTESQIRQITREEVRRILDAGLMYTEQTMEKQGTTRNTQSPMGPTAPTPSPSPPTTILQKFPPELRQHLSLKEGKVYTEFVSREKFAVIAEAATTLGYSWVSDGKNSCFKKV